jgi:hypothetical protein
MHPIGKSVGILRSRWAETVRATLSRSLVMGSKPEIRRGVLLPGHQLGILALAVALAMGHELGHRDAVRRGDAGLDGTAAGLRLPRVAGALARLGLGFHAHRRLPFGLMLASRIAIAIAWGREVTTGPRLLPLCSFPCLNE